MSAGKRRASFDKSKLRHFAGAEAFRLELEKNAHQMHESIDEQGDNVEVTHNGGKEVLMGLPELRKQLKKQAEERKKSLALGDAAIRPHTTALTNRGSPHHINNSEVSRHLVQRDWMLSHGVANVKLSMPSTITTVVSSWVKAAESPQHRLSLDPSEIPKGAPKALVDVVANPTRSSTSVASRPSRSSRTAGRDEEVNDVKQWKELEDFLVRTPKPGEPKLPQSLKVNGLEVSMSSLLMQMRRTTILEAVMKGGDNRHQWAHVAASEEGIRSQLHAFGLRPSTAAGDYIINNTSSSSSPHAKHSMEDLIFSDLPSYPSNSGTERGPSVTSLLLGKANEASKMNSLQLSPRLSLLRSPRKTEEAKAVEDANQQPKSQKKVVNKPDPVDYDWISSLEKERTEWKERERAKLEAQWTDINLRASIHIESTESDVDVRIVRNQSSSPGDLTLTSSADPASSGSPSPNHRSLSPIRAKASSPVPPPSSYPKTAQRLNRFSPMIERSSTAPTTSGRRYPPPHHHHQMNPTQGPIPYEISHPDDTIAILSSMTSLLDSPTSRTRRATSPLLSKSLPQFFVKGSKQGLFSSPYSSSPASPKKSKARLASQEIRGSTMGSKTKLPVL